MLQSLLMSVLNDCFHLLLHRVEGVKYSGDNERVGTLVVRKIVSIDKV